MSFLVSFFYLEFVEDFLTIKCFQLIKSMSNFIFNLIQSLNRQKKNYHLQISFLQLLNLIFLILIFLVLVQHHQCL
eukprot:UN13616